MATDPNQIELNADDRKLLAEASDRMGKPWRAVLRGHLAQALKEHRPSSKSDEEIARTQREQFSDLFSRLDALPDMSPDDGICVSEEHDLVLYGWDKK